MKVKILNAWTNATITIDKLHLNVKSDKLSQLKELGKVLKEDLNYYQANDLVSLGVNTTTVSQYWDVIDIFYKDEKFAYFQLNPKNTYQKPDIIPLVIYNPRFMQHGWTQILSYVLGLLHLEFHSISAIDIALDAHGINKAFTKALHDDSLELACRTDPRAQFSRKTKKLKPSKGIKLGADSSNWRFSFYEKSKEYPEKAYLKAFHEINGIDTQRTVDRCELRLNNSEMSSYQIDIEQLDRVDFLVSLYSKYSNDKLRFKDKTRYSYVNNNKAFKMIRLIEFEEMTMPIIHKKQKEYPRREQTVKSKKTAIKQITLDYLKEPENWKLDYLRYFTLKHRLNGWMERRLTYWISSDTASTTIRAVEALFQKKTLIQIYMNLLKATRWTSFAWVLMAI